jgi:hypothetical protein
MGCIRTTDEAMRAIVGSMGAAPILTIDVTNNNAPMARAASSRNRHRHLHGRHHG